MCINAEISCPLKDADTLVSWKVRQMGLRDEWYRAVSAGVGFNRSVCTYLREHDHQQCPIALTPSRVEDHKDAWSQLEKAGVFLLRNDWQSCYEVRWPHAAVKLLKLVVFAHCCTYCAAYINCRIDGLEIYIHNLVTSVLTL